MDFNRDEMASYYAAEHLEVDPGIVEIYYLPERASQREIRLLVVSQLAWERDAGLSEPLELGFHRNKPTEHQLKVLDVTPKQMELLQERQLSLPKGWSLKNSIKYPKHSGAALST